ncbi:2-C-methyl-D-erythritol 4-phosphate cytidylyltransferase [uncultured Tessaracoccus sp.]|uniref:2-C-methyl-D-erythritol 4-phosphate cytidylyltransferase n=1 Tax=uncultured Tessaracoccus sp. TaxID=905023 RepID=UPI0025D5CDC7|nr:2-C-methyl-D-erythritol 4-phosphate cytidylyltransferase [uncultured Tessaracoccus sp.]
MSSPHLQPVAAVVVAAGSGSRLGHALPKALVEVAGVPMVVRAVSALRAGGVGKVVVVAPSSHLDRFEAVLSGLPDVTVTVGGPVRQDSVRLGLAAVGDAAVVLVHDAARPLVPARVVRDVVAACREGAPAVVPVVPVIDTIRSIDDGALGVVDRSVLRAVQTPQGFDADALRRAHAHVEREGLTVTDDASACEAIGLPVMLVEGAREATKITEPFDLLVAEAIAGKGD